MKSKYFPVNLQKFNLLLLILSFHVRFCWGNVMDFSVCHDDFTLKPGDGLVRENTFPWLGFVQYIHSK